MPDNTLGAATKKNKEYTVVEEEKEVIDGNRVISFIVTLCERLEKVKASGTMDIVLKIAQQ